MKYQVPICRCNVPMTFEVSLCATEEFYFSPDIVRILICVIDEQSVLRESEHYKKNVCTLQSFDN